MRNLLTTTVAFLAFAISAAAQPAGTLTVHNGSQGVDAGTVTFGSAESDGNVPFTYTASGGGDHTGRLVPQVGGGYLYEYDGEIQGVLVYDDSQGRWTWADSVVPYDTGYLY